MLLIQRGDRFESVTVAHRGGLRYPWLERAAPGKAPAGLDLLLAPRSPSTKLPKIEKKPDEKKPGR